jgi:hypothetical protein
MKVLIGCPTYKRYTYCIDRYLSALNKLKGDFDLLLVDNSEDDSFCEELKRRNVPVEKVEYSEPARKRIVESRELLRRRAIDGGYDYFFSLEQDVIVPAEALLKLLSHQKGIVTAYYGNMVDVDVVQKSTGKRGKVRINMPLVYLPGSEPGKARRAKPQEVLGKGLMEISSAGVGCMLISTDVLRKVKFTYDPEKKACDDMLFCIDAKKEGYKIYLDSDLRVEHLHSDWTGINR